MGLGLGRHLYQLGPAHPTGAKGRAMKIIKYGEITFREGEGPDIHGWQVEREDADPADATTEQLLLGFVVLWAQAKFKIAMNSAVIVALIERAQKEKAGGGNCIDAGSVDIFKHARTEAINRIAQAADAAGDFDRFVEPS